MISSGITLLNLAMTDNAAGAFAPGRIYNLVGDSSTGKSLLALTALAEAFYNSDYKVIYDDVEAALSFDLEKLFGSKFAKEIENFPFDEPSNEIEEFFQRVLKLLNDEKKFIYVLDSLDALTSEEEIDIAKDLMKKGEIKGSYGMRKAKIMSQLLRQINLKLKNTESILIIISQTRDNLDAMSFKKRTRSGGRALEFYCTGVVWLAKIKNINKNDTQIGVYAEAKIEKNKITGKRRSITFPIYYEYGLDDIGSMFDYLVSQGVVKKSKLTYEFEELGIKGTRKTLIKKIEDENLIDKVQELTAKTWHEFEEKLKLNRKPRFGGIE